MKTRLSLLLMSAIFAGAAMAEDIVTSDGTVYRDVKITEITPIGINFISDNQACWADFRDLPPAVAQKYGFNPAKAGDFEKALAQNQGRTIADNTPVVAPTVAPATAPAVTPVATPVAAPVGVVSTTVSPVGISASTPIASATVTPLSANITTPVASVTIGALAPPPLTKVVVINQSDPVVYDTTIVAEPTTTIWVLWNGRYYPRYWWHYWYWNHRYVQCNGRYYPAHYYYHGGIWNGGRYVPYRVDSRHGYSAPSRKSSDRGRNPSSDHGRTSSYNSSSSGSAGSHESHRGSSDSRGGSRR